MSVVICLKAKGLIYGWGILSGKYSYWNSKQITFKMLVQETAIYLNMWPTYSREQNHEEKRHPRYHKLHNVKNSSPDPWLQLQAATEMKIVYYIFKKHVGGGGCGPKSKKAWNTKL